MMMPLRVEIGSFIGSESGVESRTGKSQRKFDYSGLVFRARVRSDEMEPSYFDTTWFSQDQVMVVRVPERFIKVIISEG